MWKGTGAARAPVRAEFGDDQAPHADGGYGFAMVLASPNAWADKRVALIVGNSTYQTVPQLPNPSRDASAIAKMFRDAGFDSVDLVLNVGNLDFKRAIRKFENAADQADIAVVYYAGHGLEMPPSRVDGVKQLPLHLGNDLPGGLIGER
jgi:hypothetical protein